jgi:GxxExxY protein
MSKTQAVLIEEELTSTIINAFYHVYNELGYGFLEHVYSLALERELIARGHRVSREYAAMVYYKGVELTSQRLDVGVDERVVVENKSTEKLGLAAPRQLFSYLHATRFEVGLLLHFGPQPRFVRTVASNQYKEFKSALSAPSAGVVSGV